MASLGIRGKESRRRRKKITDACFWGDLKTVRSLLPLDTKNPYRTIGGLLQVAIDNKHILIINYLLSLDPPPKITVEHLRSAVSAASISVYECLILHQPDIVSWKLNDDGHSVMLAIERNKLDFMTFLLDHGANSGRDPQQWLRDGFHLLPLELAVLLRRVDDDIIRCLIAYGADIDGSQALQCAAAFDARLGKLQVLLEEGADVDAMVDRRLRGRFPDDMDGTALHVAAAYGSRQTVGFLLAYRADTSLQDSMGRTCIERAQGDDETVALLKRHAGLGKEQVAR